MGSGHQRYGGGEIGDRDAFRLVEPDMTEEEYQAYHAAWWRQFPCQCEGPCGCQGPPPTRPKRPRLLVVLPDEPPELTPDAARALLRILLKAADQQRETNEER